MSDEIRRRFRIGGRVQGVGFRAWASRAAARLRLRGTVRNCADGSVEVEAAGAPSAIDRFRAMLADGPSLADVRDVVELEPGERPLPDTFELTY